MNAVILSIGTELTTGHNVDTNSAWLSAELTRAGVTVIRHLTVDDHLARIIQAVRSAWSDAELVILTGGLGPTADDLTRQALAEAVGEPLEENAEAMAQIRAFFDRSHRPMHEANRVQAQLPRGCDVIRNDWGTAPGIHHRHESRELFALPGVPHEMRKMFTAAIGPRLASRTGRTEFAEASLRCFGLPEAVIGQTLADLMDRNRNPQVGTLASRGVITVRILARGHSESDAARSLAADVRTIRERLGDAVFGEGDDTLESVVGGLLAERRATIAVAESCTGGLLAKRLTDVPGSSRYFLRGYVTYADSAKIDLLGVLPALIAQDGTVSEPVAGAMAAACLERSATDLALALTGIAGPAGGTDEKPVGLVYIALARPGDIRVQRLVLGGHLTREDIRDRACSVALNSLRLHLTSATPE